FASQFGCPAVIQRLLALGSEPNLREGNGLTPLDIACGGPEPLTVDALIEGGATLVADGALENAAWAGSLRAVERLVKVKPKATFPEGFSLMHLCARLGKNEWLAPLMEAGVPLDALDAGGRSPLQIA